MGIGFILLSCLVQGSQYVFEERVMAIDGLPPMWLIGLEVRTACSAFILCCVGVRLSGLFAWRCVRAYCVPSFCRMVFRFSPKA